MDEIDRLAEKLKRNIGNFRQAQIRFVECVSVDWENKTMDAKGTADGIEYFNVVLGYGYCDIKPVVGTTCLIGIIDGQEVVTFLINAEQVDLVEITSENIVFNGGDNIGLVKIKELTGRLNDIEKAFNNLLNEYKIHNHTHPQGVTTGLLVPSQVGTLEQTSVDDIENKKIRQ